MELNKRVKIYKNMFGLEAEEVDEDLIAEEANTNENYDYEEDIFNIGAVDFEDGKDDKSNEDLGDGELPDDIPDDENEDNYESETKLSADDEIVKEEARSANLVKLSGSHINTYVKNMNVLLASDLIERTGSFISNEYQGRFIEPAEEIIAKCFTDDEVVKTLKDFRELLDQKSIMSKLSGNETTPFVYEGLQVAYFLALTASLSLVGPSLQINGTLQDTAKHISFKAFNDIVEAINAIMSVKASLGTKIYYTESGVDLEDNTEASIYVNIPEINPSVGGPSSVPAGESIGNIIEIRNNGGLMDYLVVMKALEKLSFIATKVELKDLALQAVKAASDILNIDMQEGNGEEALSSIVENVRQEIIAKLDGDDAIAPSEGDDLPEDPDLDNTEDEPKEPDEEPEDPDLENMEEIAASEGVWLNALTGHFSNILHSTSLKISAGLAGVYMLYRGIARLIKNRIKDKLAKAEAEYKEKHTLKFPNIEELVKFEGFETKALKSTAGIIGKEIANRLPLMVLIAKLANQDLRVSMERVYNLEDIHNNFTANPNDMNLIAIRLLKTNLDSSIVDYTLSNTKVAIVKDNRDNSYKMYLGSDKSSKQFELKFTNGTGGNAGVFGDKFIAAMNKVCDEAFGSEEESTMFQYMQEATVEELFRQIDEFQKYVMGVYVEELAKLYPNINRNSYFCSYIGEEEELCGYLCYNIMQGNQTLPQPDATESVGYFRYGHMYEAGQESFLTKAAIGAGALISGYALFKGARWAFKKLQERRLKKEAAINQKNIDEATIHIKSEEELENFFKREKNVLNKLNNAFQYKEKDFATTAFISYMGNSPLTFRFKTRDTASDVIHADGTFFHKIDWFDVDIQEYVIGCLENITIDVKEGRNGDIILIFENKVNKKILSVSENDDYYNQYGQFGKIIGGIFDSVRDAISNNVSTKSEKMDLTLEYAGIFTDDLLIELLSELYDILGQANKAYLNEMGYGNLEVLSDNNMIKLTGSMFGGTIVVPIKYEPVQNTPNLA